MALPACPVHGAGNSRVVLAGHYGKPGARRQRFKCTPDNGDVPHRFTPELTRGPAQLTHCSECSAPLDPWAGQAGARRYQYDARQVAYALTRVSQGASYRQVSHEMKVRAKRKRLEDHIGDARLVANWVSVFTPVATAWRDLDEADVFAAWPEVIVADATNFNSRKRGQDWYGLCVAGKSGSGKAVPWAMVPSPGNDAVHWELLFRSKPGSPRLLVCDSAPAIENAARAVWPAIDVVLCNYHIARLIEGRLTPLRSSDPALHEELARELHDPDTKERARALRDGGTWREFLSKIDGALAAGLLPQGAAQAIRAHDSQMQWQFAVRQPGDPRSTGAAEGMTKLLSDTLADVRGLHMSNLYRTDCLFKLLLANEQVRADEIEWAVAIRKHLEVSGGRPARNQNQENIKGGGATLYGPKARARSKQALNALRKQAGLPTY